MPDKEIKIILTADGKVAINGIKEVESAAGSMDSTFRRLATTAASLTAGYLTMNKAAELVADTTKLAARVETMGVVVGVVGKNAGYTTGQINNYVDAVKSMGITTQAAQDSITRMSQSNIELAKSAQLARIAQDAAVIGNVNSSQALERMVYGIQTAQIEVLRTIGINVNFESSYSLLARSLGKTVDGLTEQEKSQARLNTVLNQGKAIQGTYLAAMGTVGKQALSMARYAEEAQVKLGELFKPTYAAIVQTTTDALTNLNEKLSEMQATGDLAKWGERIADTMGFVGRNASALAVGGVAVLTMSIAKMVEGLKLAEIAMGRTGVGIAITLAAVGGLELGRYLDSLQPDNKRFAALQASTKDQQEYLNSRWKSTQSQLEDSGIKGNWTAKSLADAIAAGDIEKYTVDVGGKMETRFRDVKAIIATTKEQVDATTKAFAAMGKVISDMGGIKLAFAEQDFQKASELPDDLRAITVEYQRLSGTIKGGLDLDRQIGQVDKLSDAFSQYGNTIDNVYGTQLERQRDILDSMKSYETSQNDIIKQAATVTQTEIKYNEEKLASYQDYYDELKKLQKTYYDAAVEAAKKIADIEKSKLADTRNYADAIYEAWNSAYPAANDIDQYYRDVTRLDQKLTEAMTLGGEERVRALEGLISSYASLSKQIDLTKSSTDKFNESSGKLPRWDNNIKKLTSEAMLGDSDGIWERNTASSSSNQQLNTYNEIQQRLTAVYQAITKTKDEMIAESTVISNTAIPAWQAIGEKMASVKGEMIHIQDNLTRLDSLLSVQHTLSIDTSKALSDARQLVDYYAYISGFSQGQFTGSLSVGSPTYSANSVRTVTGLSADGFFSESGDGADMWTRNTGGGYNYDGTPYVTYLDSFAKGTDYVPRTGLYKLHKGESVNTEEETRHASQSNSITIYGGINITIPGDITDPTKKAKELASALEKEFNRRGILRA